MGRVAMEGQYLDRWTEEKLGIQKGSLTAEILRNYQEKKLRETLLWAKENSEFYKNKLKNIDFVPGKFHTLPFTEGKELVEQGEAMICVPGREIHRIVTLETSGSTGKPKRVFFTKEDQELTVDFFHRGMENLVTKEDRLLILMAYKRPGSVGDLLRIGVARLGAKVHCFGLLSGEEDLALVEKLIREEQITSLVGIPGQVERLAKRFPQIKLSTVLLSGDYVPSDLCAFLEQHWGCKVFEHYGMTEMGLGCAVSCKELS
ncbi:MAG: AMP-binding protein, partial [Anaerovoracaceae bacterium]